MTAWCVNVKPGDLDRPVEVHGPEGGPSAGSMADTREHGEPVTCVSKVGQEGSP